MEIQDLVRKFYDARKAYSQIASMIADRGAPPSQIREELLAAGIPSEDIKSMMAAVFPGIPHVDVQGQPHQDAAGAHVDVVPQHVDGFDASGAHTDVNVGHVDIPTPHTDTAGVAHIDTP